MVRGVPVPASASRLSRLPEAFQERSHRRLNILTGEWVLVSPRRTQRPWRGQVDEPAIASKAPYDPDCYLCPGNRRAGGAQAPDYDGPYVFDNDYPALRGDPDAEALNDDGVLCASTVSGICRVVCYSPRHDLSLGDLDQLALGRVVSAWHEQYRELAERPETAYVQIFENRGQLLGASNSHPHGQIWATSSTPVVPAREAEHFRQFRLERGDCPLCRYVTTEVALEERLIALNDSFLAVVPFWAVWPYETLVIARRHMASMLD